MSGNGEKVVDWKEKTLFHWEQINTLAVRRFGRGALAEEAALAVIDGLEGDDWQRVRTFSGKASFATFILAISSRIMEDFARKRFGRVRPPLWVQTFGGIWQKLFSALCLERLPLLDAVEVVHQRQAAVDKAAIETAAFDLLARIPDCGTDRGLEVPCLDETLLDGEGGTAGPPENFENREQKELFRAVFQLVLGQEPDFVGEALLKKYQQLKLDLHPQEKLLLKLCYQDGLAVTEAGEMLGLNRFQAHGKMRRLLQRLRMEFDRCGLAEAIKPMLGD